MDVLGILLAHDAWTNRRVLELCATLSDEQLDRPFGLGLGTLRRTLVHVVRNLEVWTRLMDGRPVPPDLLAGETPDTPAHLIARLDAVTGELAAFARGVAEAGRLEETWTDRLDDPPATQSYGATLVHLATHGMHHRSQALHMLRRLGVPGVPEGDVLSWEAAHRDGGA